MKHGIPCVTTMTGASAASRAIFASAREVAPVRSLQELHEPRGARAIAEVTAGEARGSGSEWSPPSGAASAR